MLNLLQCLERNCSGLVSREAKYKDIYGRTAEIPQCAHIFKANCCLKVYNAHLNLIHTKRLRYVDG